MSRSSPGSLASRACPGEDIWASDLSCQSILIKLNYSSENYEFGCAPTGITVADSILTPTAKHVSSQATGIDRDIELPVLPQLVFVLVYNQHSEGRIRIALVITHAQIIMFNL